jgi:hypothetical protein
MNIVILLKLLFAHFLSDFILQTDCICNGKKENGHIKYGYLLTHSLTHAVIAYLLVSQWSNLIVPLVILITHFLIDYIKLIYKKEGLVSFIIDQTVHIAIIFIIWTLLFQDNTTWYVWLDNNWNSAQVWVIALAYLLVLRPTSIFLNIFIKRWTPQNSKDESLPNAGKWIGYLERILILTLILTKNIEVVGFLLATKSIFRFGELSKAKEIKTTEYVLIGTFASFTVAAIVGFLLLQIL